MNILKSLLIIVLLAGSVQGNASIFTKSSYLLLGESANSVISSNAIKLELSEPIAADGETTKGWWMDAGLSRRFALAWNQITHYEYLYEELTEGEILPRGFLKWDLEVKSPTERTFYSLLKKEYEKLEDANTGVDLNQLSLFVGTVAIATSPLWLNVPNLWTAALATMTTFLYAGNAMIADYFYAEPINILKKMERQVGQPLPEEVVPKERASVRQSSEQISQVTEDEKENLPFFQSVLKKAKEWKGVFKERKFDPNHSARFASIINLIGTEFEEDSLLAQVIAGLEKHLGYMPENVELQMVMTRATINGVHQPKLSLMIREIKGPTRSLKASLGAVID